MDLKILKWEDLKPDTSYLVVFNNLEGRVNTYLENYTLKDKSPIEAVLVISNPELKDCDFLINFKEKDKSVFDSFKLLFKAEYKEILKLETLLKEGNVPYTICPMFDGYKIIIWNKEHTTYLCDAIEHFGSYGHEEDKLEIMGGLTSEEKDDSSVLGWLTAEEVFKRFKYCYENNTSNYKQ